MNNNYLYIEGNKLNYCDGVFSGIVTADCVSDFCDRRAEMSRHSDLGNYEGLSIEYRESLAKRWEEAKDLPEGKYDYYFNLEDKKEIFQKMVKNIAKGFDINYELIIK